jgi:hypothetical protein
MRDVSNPANEKLPFPSELVLRKRFVDHLRFQVWLQQSFWPQCVKSQGFGDCVFRSMLISVPG